MSAVEVPTRWRSVLPRLGYELPDDRSPARSQGGAVKVNVPLELIRQSRSAREHWDIPGPVLDHYRGYRPTPLWRARRFEESVGARVPVYVKYEGGNLSGSHKLNTALAQAHYYAQAGVRELVTGTGAGQWGTALAAACATFGLRCTVFMVAHSLEAKPYRGTIMRLLGATVHASPGPETELGRRTLAGASPGSLTVAIGEAVEHAAADDDRAFAIGSGETYSLLHQSVIGLEARAQLSELGEQAGVVVGCVGAGSNFGGLALPFFEGAAGGPTLLAAESCATPKLTRGVYAYDATDATGTAPLEAMYTVGADYVIPPSHAAGLRYHAASKLISAMRHRGQIEAVAVDQGSALDAGRRFALTEGTLPAPEAGHALAAAADVAAGRGPVPATGPVLVCVSGHGYFDLAAYEQHMESPLDDVAPPDDVLDRHTGRLERATLVEPAEVGL
jgi:tryptophan synthase beta chain